MKALKILGKILAGVTVIIVAGIIYVKAALPSTGHAPDIKIERTAARMERSKYRTNHVTVCMACHHTRNWSQ